jgi:PII-like signaling protein
MKLTMLCLTIRIKRNDELNGKRLHRTLIDFLIENKISGCTVWTGVDGFGKRKRSTISLEGVTINLPLIMEVVDDKSKIESLLPQMKRIIGDNGLVTIHEVHAL